ncbi:hypothetical protein [uncultured Paraglaciecola sp.]|jgi:hypothetical protein|uniref:hypothetical protein n=1 Tax=uncultured Paraglaciecola sp. TaxID=1765024 RepID=UPI0025E92077|nr:hypothetical protein [uncultured Paraglaciecola sp.]
MDGSNNLDHATKWIELLSEYGPYALFVFFALVLWTVAKRNMDKAETDEDRVYHRRNHKIILYGVFVLAAVLVVVWSTDRFYVEPNAPTTIVKGQFSGLNTQLPLDQSHPSRVHHKIMLDQEGKFYSKIDKNLSEQYRHNWVLLNEKSENNFFFVFQQVYEEIKPQRMTDGLGINQSKVDRRELRKRFALSLTDQEIQNETPYRLLYIPNESDPTGQIGSIKRQLQNAGNLTEIPWLTNNHSYPKNDSFEIDFSIFPKAYAATNNSIFEGQDTDYIIARLNNMLSSENLKDQLDAQRILLNNHKDVLFYLEQVLNPTEQTENDLGFNYWFAVESLIENSEASGDKVAASLKIRLADELLNAGAYENASNLLKKVKVTNSLDPSTDSLGNPFKSVQLNRLKAQQDDNWITVPYLRYERLRVAYYMSPMVFYGDGCIRATYKGGRHATEEKRPRYSISLWRDDKRQGYEFYLSKDVAGSNKTEFTIYKRFSAEGSRPVTKINGRWQDDDIINNFSREENQLSICRKAQKLHFLINDKEVFTTQEPEIERHRFFGMNVAIGTQVFVKDFGICLLNDCLEK